MFYHDALNALRSDVVLSEGRGCAAEVDAWLTDGSTRLPSAGGIKTRVGALSM